MPGERTMQLLLDCTDMLTYWLIKQLITFGFYYSNCTNSADPYMMRLRYSCFDLIMPCFMNHRLIYIYAMMTLVSDIQVPVLP